MAKFALVAPLIVVPPTLLLVVLENHWNVGVPLGLTLAAADKLLLILPAVTVVLAGWVVILIMGALTVTTATLERTGNAKPEPTFTKKKCVPTARFAGMAKFALVAPLINVPPTLLLVVLENHWNVGVPLGVTFAAADKLPLINPAVTAVLVGWVEMLITGRAFTVTCTGVVLAASQFTAFGPWPTTVATM